MINKNYFDRVAESNGLRINGVSIQHVDKTTLIKAIVSIHKENKNLKEKVVLERATGIALLKDFAQIKTKN